MHLMYNIFLVCVWNNKIYVCFKRKLNFMEYKSMHFARSTLNASDTGRDYVVTVVYFTFISVQYVEQIRVYTYLFRKWKTMLYILVLVKVSYVRYVNTFPSIAREILNRLRKFMRIHAPVAKTKWNCASVRLSLASRNLLMRFARCKRINFHSLNYIRLEQKTSCATRG